MLHADGVVSLTSTELDVVVLDGVVVLELGDCGSNGSGSGLMHR
jgi:hypothetical protein